MNVCAKNNNTYVTHVYQATYLWHCQSFTLYLHITIRTYNGWCL